MHWVNREEKKEEGKTKRKKKKKEGKQATGCRGVTVRAFRDGDQRSAALAYQNGAFLGTESHVGWPKIS